MPVSPGHVFGTGAHRHSTRYERTDEPRCPCCGAAIPPNRLLVDLSTNCIVYGRSKWKVAPKIAELFQALIDAYPSALRKEQMYYALYGVHECDINSHTISVYLMQIRMIMGLIGGELRCIKCVGHQLVMPKEERP